jgi:hypothetical protein
MLGCFQAPGPGDTLAPTMAREIVSTARPSMLRLAGFLALTLGGLLVSLGSLMDWATVTPFDTSTRGVDLWEGTITLAIGFAALLGMILMRLLRPARARHAAAVAILALGLTATALAGAAAIRANERFTSPSQRDRIARALATELGLPYEEVRARIEVTFNRRFHASLDPGIFLVIAGGVMVALGGGLSVAWTARAPTPGVAAEMADPSEGEGVPS